MIDGPTFGTGDPLGDDILAVGSLFARLPPIQRTAVTVDRLNEVRALETTGGTFQSEIQAVFPDGGAVVIDRFGDYES